MIGGPCGRPVRVKPGSGVKRNFTMTQALWRFDTELDPVVWCQDERYVLHVDDKGKPYYLHEPDLALLHVIALALGQQRFWLARYPELAALATLGSPSSGQVAGLAGLGE